MPSSSKHNTAQEIRLFDCFRDTYARLHFADLKAEARTLLNIFAELFEIDASRLYKALVEEKEWWQKIKQHADKREIHDLCWSAGNYLHDAAAVLFEFGRETEGARHCEWAEELRRLALKIEASQMKQRGG